MTCILLTEHLYMSLASTHRCLKGAFSDSEPPATSKNGGQFSSTYPDSGHSIEGYSKHPSPRQRFPVPPTGGSQGIPSVRGSCPLLIMGDTVLSVLLYFFYSCDVTLWCAPTEASCFHMENPVVTEIAYPSSNSTFCRFILHLMETNHSLVFHMRNPSFLLGI